MQGGAANREGDEVQWTSHATDTGERTINWKLTTERTKQWVQEGEKSTFATGFFKKLIKWSLIDDSRQRVLRFSWLKRIFQSVFPLLSSNQGGICDCAVFLGPVEHCGRWKFKNHSWRKETGPNTSGNTEDISGKRRGSSSEKRRKGIICQRMIPFCQLVPPL